MPTKSTRRPAPSTISKNRPEDGTLSIIGAAARRNWRLLRMVTHLKTYQHTKLHAQALTFTTMVALVPFSIVVFKILTSVGAFADMHAKVQEFILARVSANAELQAQINTHVSEFIANFQSGRIGVLAAVILVWAVISLLGRIEKSFNAVYGISSTRPFLTRMLVYWALLSLGPILLAGSFALTAYFQSADTGYLVDLFGKDWQRILEWSPLAMTWIALAVMYWVVPNTRVKIWAAVLAAIAAGSMWNGAKFAYAFYTKQIVSFENIYGSLATIPLFILWVYFSWLLVLLGVYFTYALQHSSARELFHRSEDLSHISRERCICAVYVEVVRDYYNEASPPNESTLASRLFLPWPVTNYVVNLLVKGGYLTRTEQKRGLKPAADPGKVSLYDLLAFIRVETGDTLSRMVELKDHRTLARALDKVERAVKDNARQTTFDQLVS